jgi:hypothetical protein
VTEANGSQVEFVPAALEKESFELTDPRPDEPTDNVISSVSVSLIICTGGA